MAHPSLAQAPQTRIIMFTDVIRIMNWISKHRAMEIRPRQKELEHALRNMADFIVRRSLYLAVRQTACGATVHQWKIVVYPNQSVYMSVRTDGSDGMYAMSTLLEDPAVTAHAILQFVENARVCPVCRTLAVDHGAEAKAKFA